MSSLNREKADEICKHIKENSGAIFGQKFWECRLACALLAQQKADRWEPRFMAIAKFRVFILHGKSVNSLKIEKSFNIVALRYLELLQQDHQLQFGWEERVAKPSVVPPMLHVLVRFPDDETEERQQHHAAAVRELALDLLATLKHYFPDIHRSLAKHFLTITPSLVADFPSLPNSVPELPCHNFRRSYVAHCDCMEQPFRDEVIWDIERIYFVHGQHELDLNDFSHLPAKDLQALIGAVQFSDFFTGLSANALRLQPEHVDALVALLRRSHSLRSLRLCRCTTPKDFVAQLAAALALNQTLPLEKLRLSELSLEDKKGLVQLGTLLPQLPAFHTLFLTDCALNEKSALCLLHAFHHGIELAAESARAEAAERRGSSSNIVDHTAAKAKRLSSSSSAASAQRFQLRALNLSGNQLGTGAELAEQLANLVALSGGALRLLDLSGTAIQLDRLWSALKLGGLGLEVLRLGACYCTPSSSKRSGSAKDSAQVARELFTAAHSLKELNLSGTHIGPELLQGILSGLSANQNIAAGSLHFCLDSAIVGSAACVSVLEQHIGGCDCICSLSLRDNALEHEAFRLLSALSRTTNLRILDIGGANFFALKTAKKHAQVLAGILAELVKLINGVGEDEEGSFIEELSLADARLGPHMSVFLNALGLCGRLKRLDLSNNELGPAGARLLCKSLQLNHALRWLALDRNQIGPDGFAELARALRVNIELDGLQMPFSDAAECVVSMARLPSERARFQLQMEEIEQYLERNQKIRALSPTMETIPLGHFVLKTIHKLNNVRMVEVNESILWKISVNITGWTEVRSDSGTGQPCADDGEICGVNAGHELKMMADQLAERIEHVADVDSERFLQKFALLLADQEGVQMHAQEQQAAIDQQKCITNKRLGAALREDLVTLMDKYQKEFAWSHLFSTVHHCLLGEDAQEMFRVEEKPSASYSTRTRKEVTFRNGTHSHRPESAMMSNDDSAARSTAADAMAAVLMSRSVMGDFAHANNDGQHKKNKYGGEAPGAANLVHLAKQRPKPARLNRSRIQPTAATRMDDNDGTKPFSVLANGHISSAGDCVAATTLAPSSSSPSMDSANLLNSSNSDGSPPFVHPTASSPPMVPPRREKMGCSSPMTPPRLPPKPSSPGGREVDERAKRKLRNEEAEPSSEPGVEE
uniref:CARMIL pleckstrin homology domain-containing protein n=1 Tax=Globodera rostochiensis TaxID=31243 RepID=A0A914GQ65_GLORO